MNLALAALSAVLLIALFPPVGVSLLAPLALAPLLIVAARQRSAFVRFLLGEASGIIYWAGHCYWIKYVLTHHGGMDEGMSWISFLLFCFLKALHMAVFLMLVGPILWKPWGILGAAALWSGMERLHGEFGFQWLLLGNAGADMGVPLRLAPWVGVYGVSFVFAMMSGAVAMLALRMPRVFLTPLVALPLLYLLPDLPPPLAGQNTAVAVQANAPQSARWTAAMVEELRGRMVRQSLELSLDPKRPVPTLLLWPESPAPLYFYTDPDFQSEARKLARSIKTHFLFGTVAYDPRTNAPLNRALLLNPEGEPVVSYDKMYLVPFGEFVPPVFGFVNRITQEAGDFQPGKQVVVAKAGDHTIGTFICYESAFPELVRRFANEGAEVLVNLTNDGYFGRTAARDQHLLLARMRAAENRRWILRATNDGVTAAIDPAGRVTQTLPSFDPSGGRLNFNWLPTRTAYTRHGDWFAWSCLGLGVAASLIASLLRAPRRQVPPPAPAA